ncbi:MAG TPA: M14 family zinc carboxypeptidase [bacterium]
MKIFRIALFALVLLWTAMAFAEAPTHLLVRVLPGTKARLQELYSYSRLDLVPGDSPMQPNLVALPEDLQFLTEHGFAYEILQQSIEQFYASRLHDMPGATMGGYHTFAEIQSAMDSIHNEHPTIAGTKFSIGSTYEGRSQWVMKISSSPNSDNGMPEVFFNSMIHAREPEGMEALLYFARWLTNGYGSDPMATYLVNNRQIYFLPCVNPDGYEYNRSTNPSGGGMWRKNRKPNGDGTYGVDCNRNFDLAWGIDNNGSSPNTSDETYRGPSAFSELETQHLRDFINAHHFVTEQDCHTYQDDILIVWGTSYYPPPSGNGLCADDATYRMILDSMNYFIHQNSGIYYATGAPWQILYNTNGGSCDWEYASGLGHSKIFALTTEIGNSSDGFWPPQSRILPLAQENLGSFIFLARVAGPLAPRPYQVTYNSQCQSEVNGNGNGITEPGEGLNLNVTLKNSGTSSLTNIQGVITTTDPYVTIAQGTSAWADLISNATGTNTTPFRLTVSAGCPAIHFIPLNLHVTAANLDTNIALNATVGNSCLYDQVENGTNGWTTGGTQNQWHVATRRYSSATHAWLSGADAGNYADNMSAYLLSPTLIMGAGAQLIYDQWYALESNFDYGYVEVNTGSGWVQVGTTVTGSSNAWVHTTVNLPVTCAGTPVQIRFRMTSDANTNAEGWYIDNINTGCPPPSQLIVGVPNGGESWYTGESNNITWTSQSFSDNVRIELNRSYPSATWETIVASTGNTGSYSWPVTGPVSTTARVRIKGVTQTTVGDTSNANFTIATRSLTVTAPNGGESWVTGTNNTITWTSTNVSENVKIELNRSYPGATWETITAGTGNTGSYVWNATTPATSSARVRIIGLVHPTLGDTSNGNFFIGQPGVTVTSPNGGESWIIGTTHTITWTSLGVSGNMFIDLNRAYPGGSWETLSASAPNSGSFSWTVAGSASSSVRVRVTSLNNSAYNDLSDNNFALANPNQPPVIVHDPLHDQQPATFTVTALVTDDASGFVTRFFYKLSTALYYDSLLMGPTANPNEFAGSVPPLAAGSYVYYVKATDAVGAATQTTPFTFYVGGMCGTETAYDDGISERSNWSPNPFVQWGVKFTPSAAPFALCYARIGISADHPDSSHSPVQVQVRLADGLGGLPGTVLQSRTVGSIGNVPGGVPPIPAPFDYVVFNDNSGNPLLLNGDFYITVSNSGATGYEAFLQDTSSAYAGHSYYYDCDSLWHNENSGLPNARLGNRMIRAGGFSLTPPTIVVSTVGSDAHLNWTNLHAPYYRVYSALTSDGPFTTLVGSTTDTSFVQTGGANLDRKFYTVRASTLP